MSKDEPFLSDHEQRILAEIERNLAAEDPDFVRNVSEVRPKKDSSRTLRLGVLGVVLGLVLLLLNTQHVAAGIGGFLLMLVSVVAIVSSARDLASSGRSPGSAFRDALKRAEDKMRSRRRDK